ncbi:MAG: hypothetical protein J6K32_04850 [Clostridia bacterium]|nr:hypothetical protein [Clostridia bacterium]
MKRQLDLWSRRLLLLGMGLMIPCYLFTAGNVLLSPWPLYGRNRIALTALTLLGAALLLIGMRTVDRHEAFLLRHEKKLLAATALFYFIVQMVMGAILRYAPNTDAEQCFTAAQLIVDSGTFGSNERSFIYFTRYPHNLGYVYLLAGLFRFFGALGWADRYMQAVLAASLLFTPGLICSARVCRRLGGVKAQGRMLLLFAACLPLLYCTSEMYTDAFSVSFSMMTIWAFLHLRDARTWRARILYALLGAALAFIGAQIRFTVIIAAIACVIALLFERRGRAPLCAAAALCAVFLAGGAAVDAYTHTHLSEEDIAKNELPKLHYMVMGLPVQPDEGYGQYGYGGWLIFSTSFEDPDERRDALMTEFIDRVYYLRYPNRLMHMVSRKNLSTFGDGTFALNEIIQADTPQPDHPVKQVIFAQGALYPAYRHLCTALFAAQMLIACLACWQRIRRGDTACAPLYITLVGVFIILTIWETRARYFFFAQMVLLCAAALAEPGFLRKKKPD